MLKTEWGKVAVPKPVLFLERKMEKMDVERLRNIVKNKCFNYKYHNSLKFMIHNCGDVETRDELLKDVFYCDAYLGSKIYMSMCDDSEKTKQLIDEVLIDVKYRAKKELRKLRVLLAYLELEEFEDFYEYYAEIEDILNKNEFSYVARNISYRQMLIFMRAMANGRTKIGWTILARYIKQVYTPDYDDILYELLEDLLIHKKYELCSTVLAVTKFENKMLKLLTKEEHNTYLEELIKSGITNRKKYILYLSLQYGYEENGNNSDEMVQKILDDTQYISGAWYVPFIKNLSRNMKLDNEQKIKIMLKIGMEEKAARDIICKGLFDIVMLTHSGEKAVLTELVDDRPRFMEYITYTINTMQFPFSAREKISTRSDAVQYDRSREYSVFNEYMEKENDPNKITYLYFNSIFRYIVNLEYVVEYLKNRFFLNEKQLKTTFGDYILWGRVCKVNDYSVSIRVKNVFTLRPCRMNTNKYWIERDGLKVKLKEKDDFFFKFAYMMDDGAKINVHFPTFSIEEMHNIESRRRYSREENL